MLVLGTIAAHTGSPRRPPRHHWLAPACQAQGIRTQRTGISAKGILSSRQAKGLIRRREGFWERAHQSAKFEALPGICTVQYCTMKVPKSQPRTGQYNAPLGLFAASFSRKSLEATSPRLGTIHETLNSLSCTLSSRATSQQELVSPGALTSHAFTVECGCGLRGAIACTMPMGMAPELLSLSLRTHTLSVRGGARAAFPRNEPDRHASTHPIRAHKARCPDLQGSLATAPHRPALT